MEEIRDVSPRAQRMNRITAPMMAAGKAALERHSWDNGGTYEVTCTAETLCRDIFKAMLAAMPEM